MSEINDYHARVFDKLLGNPVESALMESIPDRPNRDDSLSAAEKAEREERIEERVAEMMADEGYLMDAFASGIGLAIISNMIRPEPRYSASSASMVRVNDLAYSLHIHFRPIAEQWVDDHPIDHELQRADRERE